MSSPYTLADETRIAEEIVSVLPAGSVARLLSDDHEAIRYAVQSSILKLRTIVLCRKSLARLQGDPARAIKIDYLQRDLLRSAIRRVEFRYPRINRIINAIRGRRRRGQGRLAMATAGVNSCS